MAIFEGKGASGDKNEYNLFIANDVLNIFLLKAMFSKKTVFFEKTTENRVLRTTSIFFRRRGHFSKIFEK